MSKESSVGGSAVKTKMTFDMGVWFGSNLALILSSWVALWQIDPNISTHLAISIAIVAVEVLLLVGKRLICGFTWRPPRAHHLVGVAGFLLGSPVAVFVFIKALDEVPQLGFFALQIPVGGSLFLLGVLDGAGMRDQFDWFSGSDDDE